MYCDRPHRLHLGLGFYLGFTDVLRLSDRPAVFGTGVLLGFYCYRPGRLFWDWGFTRVLLGFYWGFNVIGLFPDISCHPGLISSAVVLLFWDWGFTVVLRGFYWGFTGIGPAGCFWDWGCTGVLLTF